MIPFGGVLLFVLAFPARAERWAGPYAGLHGGHAWGQASTAFDGDGDGDGMFGLGQGIQDEPQAGGFNSYPRGAIYGVHAGYNVAVWERLLAGVEVSYDHGNIFSEVRDPFRSFNFPGERTTYKLVVDTLFSLGPQVGVAWGPLFVRAKGGTAAGRVVSRLWSSTNNVGTIVGPTSFDADQTRFGWLVGGGLDVAVTDHWSVGGEFSYVDLGIVRYGGKTSPDVYWPISYAIHPILKTATARLSYHFGGPAEGRAPKATAPPPEPERRKDKPWKRSMEREISELTAELKAPESSRRARAAVALGQLGSRDGVPPLVSALDDASPTVRGAAADALGKLGDRHAAAPLAPLLKDKDPRVRALAARAMGAAGGVKDIPALRRAAARDQDARVREAAEESVKRLELLEPDVDRLLLR